MGAAGDEFMTVGELADRWRLARQTILRQIDNGTIPAIMVGGGNHRRLFRISTKWVAEYEQTQSDGHHQ